MPFPIPTTLLGPARTSAPLRTAAASPAVRWLLLATVCYFLGNAARWAGIPAAHLLTALVVGVIASLTGTTRSRFPTRANRSAQAVVGVLMGSYLGPGAVRSVVGSIGPLVGVTLATVVLCLGVALILPRLTRMSHSDAVLGMVPGGSAAIIACADDLDADSRVVAFMQYLRVGMVAASAPVVVLALHTATHAGNPAHARPFGSALLPDSLALVNSSHTLAGLLVLAALCTLGGSLGRRLRLPAPTLLGPMLLTAVGVVTGAAHGFQPVGPLQDAVFVVIGLEVGSRFTRPTLRHVGRMLPYVLAATFTVCLMCAALAGALAAAVGISFNDAYLATTPGGINAVLATAASLHSNVALISTSQSLRLFLVVMLTPLLIRWVTSYGARTVRRHAV
ncbi:AbrB family transcriptional regulator [Streptomyces sp. NBC_00057]|uniref:AbrB family transcriptional regulator n=1 Tax=Streptomyces sp. NBC_00057 TaxID=2975634 RepID=UPI00324B61A7